MNHVSSVPKRALAMALSLAILTSACTAADNATTGSSGSATAGPTPTIADSADEPTASPTVGAIAEEAAVPPTAAAEQARQQLAPGEYTIDIRHDGLDRSYRMHVPDQVQDPAAVVIALHGGGGTGLGFQEENGLDAVADREGFIAVYPEGTGLLPDRLHTWNSGFNCCGWALDRNVDDVGFLREVIADVGDRATMDTGRVYMTGHSNGSMMAYRFAAEEAGLVTAIVTVGGAQAVEGFAPSQPVAVLHIHSVDDPRALYKGGEGPPFPLTNRTIPHEPVMAGIDAWVRANGCEPTPTQGDTVVGDGPNEGQTMDHLTWDNCDNDVRVEHLRLTGSGHGWPGAEVTRVMEGLVGERTTLIDASEQAWAFASQFSR